MIPNVLTIAGSDSGGGAGVQADLKAFSAAGAYGASVLCALTAQNTRGVTAIHDVPPDFVTAQLDAVFTDIRIDAVKIGMLSRPEIIEAVAAGLERHHRGPVVLDPVMVAKGGAKLLADESVEALKARLLPLATVLTPNLPEAGALLGRRPPEDEAEMRTVGEALRALGPAWVLVKGGHLETEEAVDLLFGDGVERRLVAPRVSTKNTHGTGCTLSSSIAARLARGLDVEAAVAEAKAYLSGALAAADALDVGSGHGPVHHFFALWTRESGE